jgi:hypothetical protein
MIIPSNHPGHWQHFILRNDNRGLTTEQMRQKYLKEQLLYENYISFQMQQQWMMSNASAGGGSSPSSTPSPGSGDLTLVFSSFDTIDLFLPDGVDSLNDWNTQLVATGNPYTSISVDEPSYTIYLSGGSNIVLKDNAFNGILENPYGFGYDLLQIQDNGTITEVGDYSFYYCQNLTLVELLGATVVGDYAFANCTKLQYTYLPNVTSVGIQGFIYAFNLATSPLTLYLPLCTSLGAAALNGPIEIDLPNTITATFPIVMETNGTGGGVNDEIQQLIAYSSGAIIVYV